MKRTQLALFVASALLASSLAGQTITPVGIAGTGTYSNDASLLIDGITPPESTGWTSDTNVYWNGFEPAFTIDLGAQYNLTGITWSVDNNDSYALAWSVDGSTFTNLFTVGIDDGNVQVSPGGMDTMSSFSGDPEYVAAMNFAPTTARYLRVAAVTGDSSNAVGEVTAYGTAIPEPSTYAAILGAATLGLALWRRHTRR